MRKIKAASLFLMLTLLFSFFTSNISFAEGSSSAENSSFTEGPSSGILDQSTLIKNENKAGPNSTKSLNLQPTGVKNISNDSFSTYASGLHSSWSIRIKLPKVRDNYGSLYVYKTYIDPTTYTYKTQEVYNCVCLGKGSANPSSPDSWKVTNGNTPTGTYSGYTAPPQYPTLSYGPYGVIMMDAIGGNALLSGRTGIWIHGGRSQTNLWNTNGCIRVFDNDIKNIIYHINSTDATKGTITIEEV
ncbi:MAG: L,D-transpeptidase [Clostridia bacterium]|nr:L,D-transpeptidase [Clostridia bacterium]